MTVHQLTILHKVKKKYIRESSQIWDIGQKIEGKWLYSLGNIVKKDEMHNIKVVWHLEVAERLERQKLKTTGRRTVTKDLTYGGAFQYLDPTI